MPPKNAPITNANDALFLINQIKALGIQLTFNVHDVAANSGLTAATAQTNLLALKKKHGLKIKTTMKGDSSAGAGTTNSTPRSTPVTANATFKSTRSSRGKKKDVDYAESADEEEEVEEEVEVRPEEPAQKQAKRGSKVPRQEDAGSDIDATELKRKTRSTTARDANNKQTAAPKSIPKEEKKRSTSGSSQVDQEDASDDLDHSEEEQTPTPKTRAGRTSAGLDELEGSLPVEGPRSMAASSESKDATKDEGKVGITGDQDEVDGDGEVEDVPDESGRIVDKSFVDRLLDDSSNDVLVGTKRKRSVSPQMPSPILSPTVLGPGDLMPSDDLASTPEVAETVNRAPAGQADMPSKPPPAKKAKLDVAGQTPETSDIPSLDSIEETKDLGALGEGVLLETKGAESPAQLRLEEKERELVEKDSESQELDEVASAGDVARSQSLAAGGTPARERRTFFTNPLRWMSYNRDAQPAEPPKAFEASVDDQGRPYPQRGG
ncbi:hypothetical protein PMZ80_010527 [Knufia obscura]|uniref:Uncharacterized protein n=2 Tax=Knufia TaxID=430999 RepID=A0AAN8I4M0_9EURO|nr:hypothetical protein PMZ80_010527 [Knufia obscura]KAK5950120.1 hypothetical protein OHC33_008835 [Knufia fluminis]